MIIFLLFLAPYTLYFHILFHIWPTNDRNQGKNWPDVVYKVLHTPLGSWGRIKDLTACNLFDLLSQMWQLEADYNYIIFVLVKMLLNQEPAYWVWYFEIDWRYMLSVSNFIHICMFCFGCMHWQLGDLMVKMLARCTGDPRFDPRVENQNFQWSFIQNPSWTSFGWDVKLAVPCTNVYAGQVKDPTHEVNV